MIQLTKSQILNEIYSNIAAAKAPTTPKVLAIAAPAAFSALEVGGGAELGAAEEAVV